MSDSDVEFVVDVQSGSGSDFEMVGDEQAAADQAAAIAALAAAPGEGAEVLFDADFSEQEAGSEVEGLPEIDVDWSDSEWDEDEEEGVVEDGWSDVSSQSSGSSGVDVGGADAAVTFFELKPETGAPLMETLDGVTSSNNHHQTADALLIASPSGRTREGEGSELLVHTGRFGQQRALELWRPGPGPSTRLCQAPLPLRPYTLAMSSDGSLVAVGGESGYLALYRLHAAGETPHEPRLTPLLMLQLAPEDDGHSNMCNCVRFGWVGGRERLVVAEQAGYVTLLELPPAATGRHSEMSCRSLSCTPEQAEQALQPERLRGVYAHRLQLVTAAGQLGGNTRTWLLTERTLLSTLATGTWPCAVNCALTSPDGAHIAVTGDAPQVWLLPRAHGYRYEHAVELRFDQRDPSEFEEWPHESGCQYAAWSDDSQLLAASCDTMRCVAVWNVKRGEQTHLLNATRAVLPLRFAPWDERLLVYAEEAKYIHIAYLHPDGHATMQQLSVPRCNSHAPEPHKRRRINGISIDEQRRQLYAATRDRVVRWTFYATWTVAKHATFPATFRSAVRTLLMAASTDAATGQPRHPTGYTTGLWSLPREVLLTVVEKAASPIACWSTPQ